MGIRFKFNVKRRIVVNGVEYDSPDELPPELRAAYEKAAAMRDGTAGVSVSAGMAAVVQNGGTKKITVNGRTYDSLEAMPEADRQLYEQAMGALRAESATGAQTAATPPPPASSILREKPRRDVRRPADTGAPRGLVTAAVLLALALAAAAAWVILHRR